MVVSNVKLNKARDEFTKRRQVIFLGPPGSGKTVVATLIKNALYAKDGFLEKNDFFEANLVEGNAFLNQTEGSIFSGNFPAPTPTGSIPAVIFRIKRKDPLGGETDLHFRDISGENYNIICLGRDNVDYNAILNIGLTPEWTPEQYSRFSYIMFGKLYVIIIDCKEFQNWPKEDTRNSQLLNTLRYFEGFQTIPDADGMMTIPEKITLPIAILLTKSDTLTEETDLPPEELISNYMPQFYKTLKMLHNGKCDFFKVHVDPQPDKNNNTQNEIQHVKNPLSYSKDEYVRLISWIVSNIK